MMNDYDIHLSKNKNKILITVIKYFMRYYHSKYNLPVLIFSQHISLAAFTSFKDSKLKTHISHQTRFKKWAWPTRPFVKFVCINFTINDNMRIHIGIFHIFDMVILRILVISFMIFTMLLTKINAHEGLENSFVRVVRLGQPPYSSASGPHSNVDTMEVTGIHKSNKLKVVPDVIIGGYLMACVVAVLLYIRVTRRKSEVPS